MPWVKETATQYFANKAINCSMIKRALISPRNILLDDVKDSKALQFGRALHYRILEPDKFESSVKVRATAEVDTKKFIEQKAKYENADDMAFIKSNEFGIIDKMRESFKNTPEAVELVKRCIYERSGYYKLSKNLTVKIRPDGRCKKECRMLDIKTATEKYVYDFQKAIVDYQYDIQAGYYTAVANKIDDMEYDTFDWIVFGKEEPYPVIVYHCSPDFLRIGQMRAVEGMHIIKEARETGNYKGVVEDVITPPSWYVKRYKHYLQ